MILGTIIYTVVIPTNLFFPESPWKDKNINLALYSKRSLSDKFNLYWRLLKENGEIEVIMMVNGTTYAGKKQHFVILYIII